MVAPIPVSCTIIAFNEADRIERCIRSVAGLAAEVVVIDSGSTDGTAELARALGARVLHRPWLGYGPQKRLAEEAAAHDWILNLDADEWLTEPLRQELVLRMSRPLPPAVHGIRFRIVTVYPFADRPRLFADAHHYVRLYDRRRCRFPASLVHDEVKLARGHVERARAPIYHHSIRSIGHLVAKNAAYFQLQGSEIRKSRLELLLRFPLEPLATFLKYYFLRRHVTGGMYGLAIALAFAYLRTYRLAALAVAARPAARG
jgi:glycosyltransferase involved in cell wall biosynthesis